MVRTTNLLTMYEHVVYNSLLTVYEHGFTTNLLTVYEQVVTSSRMNMWFTSLSENCGIAIQLV